MSKLKQLKERLQKFDPNETLNKILSTAQSEQFIADLVRKRLNEKGEDSTGKKIKTYGASGSNAYAARTIVEKQIKGQVYNHVTLRDTGSFQKSFEVELKKEMFNITGDSDKENGQIEDNVDLTNVLNLSDKEKGVLANEIKPKYIQAARNIIKV